ncbi:MAG: hypothetical protein ACKV1O_15965 [Saprospiraceae bacterium]
MESDQRYDRLEAYLEGDMDRAERVAFEQLLHDSTHRQQEMAMFKKIRRESQYKGLAELETKKQFVLAVKQYQEQQAQESTKYILWLQIAAIGLGGVAVALYYFFFLLK